MLAAGVARRASTFCIPHSAFQRSAIVLTGAARPFVCGVRVAFEDVVEAIERTKGEPWAQLNGCYDDRSTANGVSTPCRCF